MGRRHNYKNDYVIQEQSEEGKEKVVYQGDYYELKLTAKEKKKTAAVMLFGVICLISVFVLSAAINNAGSRIIYIMLPYILCFLPLYYELTGCIALLHSEQKMTKLQFERSVLRLKKSSLSCVILCVTVLIGELIKSMLTGITFLVLKEFLFLGGVVILLGGNIGIYKTVKRLIVE